MASNAHARTRARTTDAGGMAHLFQRGECCANGVSGRVAGKFAAEAATNCSACEAPPGNACSVGSVSTEGTACPGHLVCPGGALGGNPVFGIVVGVYAAASLVGACYIAYEILFRPERCGGCGESTDCSRPSLRVVKKRLVAALLAFASWLLLAVLAGHAVPWVLPALGGGMIAVAVLASLLSAVAVPALYFAWPKWINQSFCCLCQQGGNPMKVHIDIEANSCVCGGCKTRYQGMHQAPGGVLAYDDRAARALIVGVETKLALKSGFVPGLPSTKFEASSAAGLGAKSLTDKLQTAIAVQLPQAVTALMDVYHEVEALVSNLRSSTDTVRQLQEAAAKLFPLSSQLESQSLATLEKELDALKSAERAAAESDRYDEAKGLSAQHAQKTQEVYDYKKFKNEFLDPLRTCFDDMVRTSQNLGNLFSRADAAQKTIETRSKELNDASGALKQELETASSLTDHVLAWLQTRELSNLKSTALAASLGIVQKMEEWTRSFSTLLQQGDELWKEACKSRQAALAQVSPDP